MKAFTNQFTSEVWDLNETVTWLRIETHGIALGHLDLFKYLARVAVNNCLLITL